MARVCAAISDSHVSASLAWQLVISVAQRDFRPHLSMPSLYVLASRVKEGDSLRVLRRPPAKHGGLTYLRGLAHSQELAAWMLGYDADGRWDVARARAVYQGDCGNDGGRPRGSKTSKPIPEVVKAKAAGARGLKEAKTANHAALLARQRAEQLALDAETGAASRADAQAAAAAAQRAATAAARADAGAKEAQAVAKAHVGVVAAKKASAARREATRAKRAQQRVEEQAQERAGKQTEEERRQQQQNAEMCVEAASKRLRSAQAVEAAEVDAAAEAIRAAGRAATASGARKGTARSSGGGGGGGRGDERQRVGDAVPAAPPRISDSAALERLAELRHQYLARCSYSVNNRTDARRRMRQDQDDEPLGDGRPLAHQAYARNRQVVGNAGWPKYPKPAVAPVLPVGVAVRVRLVDFAYHQGSETARMHRYLCALGCDAGAVDASARQYAFTCGIVAARVLCWLWCAVDWVHADVHHAVRDVWTRSANAGCQLFSDAVLDATELLPRRAICDPGRPPSRFLSGAEVNGVVEHFYATEWTQEVRTAHRPDGTAELVYGGAVSTDEFVCMLAKDVALVRDRWNGCTSQWRAFALNDSDSRGTGSHWVAAVYEVRLRSQMAG